MTYERKPNTAVLFPNSKRRNDQDPHMTGSALVECPQCGNTTEYRAAAWRNKSKAGLDYLRINVSRASDKPARSFADVEKDDLDDLLK